MVKVDVISGFLGAGKTTLIQKLFKTKIANEKVALIENEFGEIGVDGAFLKNSGIEIKEINSGCICCSLVGNFEESLRELIDTYNPDRIIIEPSGVGKLSDIISAIKNSGNDLKLNVVCTVVDGGKCKMYLKNFGEFYIDQIREANAVLLSKTDKLTEQKIIEACELIKTYNPTVTIITTPITELNGDLLLDNLEETVSLVDLLIEQVKKEHGHHHHHHDHDEECECGHHHHHDHDEECECGHHHHHDHDEECECGHHHHDHDEECECGHHHHDHDEECECGHRHHDHDEECECGHHHHDHDEECECGHHHHDHDGECCCGHHHHHDHDGECCCGHHHHDADEIFASWGVETPISYTRNELNDILNALEENILRSKGVVKGADIDGWYYFDFVAGDFEIREGAPDIIGKICVIGTNLNQTALEKLFLKKV